MPRHGSSRTCPDLGSDPLYVALCERQECFRARVSPKPWRIGISRPPIRFTFLEPGQEAIFREWEKEYQAADRYATCEPIGAFGVNDPVHPDVDAAVTLHDTLACVAGAPLA